MQERLPSCTHTHTHSHTHTHICIYKHTHTQARLLQERLPSCTRCSLATVFVLKLRNVPRDSLSFSADIDAGRLRGKKEEKGKKGKNKACE